MLLTAAVNLIKQNTSRHLMSYVIRQLHTSLPDLGVQLKIASSYQLVTMHMCVIKPTK